jgi:hypothetical protein
VGVCTLASEAAYTRDLEVDFILAWEVDFIRGRAEASILERALILIEAISHHGRFSSKSLKNEG